MGYPPFECLIRVILRGPDEAVVTQAAPTLGNTLRTAIDSGGLAARILGPAPAPVTRLKNLFRYHLQLAAPQLETLQTLWRTSGAPCTLPAEIELAVDVDPINLR
jgi:primosomal protein N' (replication factor Y)